ncbi:hypothetical protein ACLMJK_007362 [Lecanora helva]
MSLTITLIGAGTIGLSFAALHLKYALRHRLHLVVHDTRPDIEEYVRENLPKYIDLDLAELHGGSCLAKVKDQDVTHKLTFSSVMQEAVEAADIIQEQGPENASFKNALWPEVEKHCPPSALLWSSTSGIPASVQSANMRDPSRLIVVHPYNPPHVMPLLEIVPSPFTNPNVIEQTMKYWEDKERKLVLVKKETTGFVANRLAFALFREAIHLVNEGVATVKDIDDLMTSSLGPRWAVAGVFKSYHAGGGAGGLEGWFQNIGTTVQGCWDDLGQEHVGEGWQDTVFDQTKNAYGVVDTRERDEKTRSVLAAVAASSHKAL